MKTGINFSEIYFQSIFNPFSIQLQILIDIRTRITIVRRGARSGVMCRRAGGIRLRLSTVFIIIAVRAVLIVAADALELLWGVRAREQQ